MNDYDFKTTMWNDFTIAEKYGVNAIQDLYNKCFETYKNDYICLTELVLVLNWKLWQHYENENIEIALFYNELWKNCDNYAINNLKGTELEYFIITLD